MHLTAEEVKKYHEKRIWEGLDTEYEIGPSFRPNEGNFTSIDLSPLKNVTDIECYFLHSCKITNINLSPLKNVDTVDSSLFWNCPNLLHITWPHTRCWNVAMRKYMPYRRGEICKTYWKHISNSVNLEDAHILNGEEKENASNS